MGPACFRCAETERVVKSRLVKFISKCVNECQTQTDQDRSENILYREMGETTCPKTEVVKPITQERKDELCDTDTTTGEGESVKNAQRGRGDHLSTIQIMSAVENLMIMMTIKS